MLSSKGLAKTVLLKSPDSDKVREVIVTSVLLPKSDSENNRTSIIRTYRNSEGVFMEKRVCKRRLDHLSLEEKILRKKLKNREAAQTSRDKKKARLEELESTLVALQSENEVLHEEVRSLNDDMESLKRENARLSEEVWRLSVASGPSGPAASCPLPKGVRPPPALRPRPHLRPQRLAPSLLHTLACLLFASTTRPGTGSTMCPLHPSLKNLSNSQILSLLKLVIQKKKKQRRQTWWGRKQKAWNPVGHPWRLAKRNQ